MQDDPTAAKPIIEPFPLNTTSGNAPSEVERVCRDNELVIGTWSPIHLRTKLKEFYWKGGKSAVGAMAFWEDSLRYLYLPRLKNRHSLSQAILSGAASRDFFGTAYGQSGEAFEGFHFGDGNIQFDDTLLLIEPAAADRYEASLKIKTPDDDGQDDSGDESGSSTAGGTSGTGFDSGGQTGTSTTPGPGTGATATARLRSFHGSVQISPSTAKLRLVEIADEIISVLAGDPNASLDITVEISAEFPSGASDQIKRAVTENATSLGFKTKSWE